MAYTAYFVTAIFLSLFMVLLIYNLIRCYTRTPLEKNGDLKNYSKELQTISDEDAILDLSGTG